jgi:MerR family mercuric resistance operon transcriptional regulator
MTIGTVARLAGVGVETVRFYERAGLIEGPQPPQFGYRQYPPDVVKRIQFIRRAKEVGFSLKEIHTLLALRLAPGTTCSDVRRQAEAKITEIEGKIADLARMKHALIQVAGLCSGAGPLSDCPILDALDTASASERAT